MAILSADGQFVTVEYGDTLESIAEEYGNGLSANQIASMNNITDPELIYKGQKIRVQEDPNAFYGSITIGPTGIISFDENAVIIEEFGLQSTSSNTLFATWSFYRSHVEKYEFEWEYDLGTSKTVMPIWFVGTKSSTTDTQSTYTIPDGAVQVRFRVKAISQKYTSNDKETTYWTSKWTSYKVYDCKNLPPQTPPTPDVEIKKNKLTATINNISTTLNASTIIFEVWKDDVTKFKTGKATVESNARHVSFTCDVEDGHEYKVRCRSYRYPIYSEWSDYSENVATPPTPPQAITVCRANSKTSIYLEWTTSATAETYDIEYTTKKVNFDLNDQITSKTGIEFTKYEVTGLEAGKEYFFRVRAVSDKGISGWSSIASVIIGNPPDAPTTWSSTTTAIVGNTVNLYWIHNSEDASSQTFAEIELTIDGKTEVITVNNSTDEDEKDKTSVYPIDTSVYVEGSKILWRIRTAGISRECGEWSTQRTIDIYAQPTLELDILDVNNQTIAYDTLTSLPLRVTALAGPKTQYPTGYNVTITSNDVYETVDNTGNVKMVNIGEEIYSRFFNTIDPLDTIISAGDIRLENGMGYTVRCVVSMDSGLTAEATVEFNVSWSSVMYSPNAEVNIDTDALTAHIHPYCESITTIYYRVDYDGTQYVLTDTEVELVSGGLPYEETFNVSVYTTTGEMVYSGKTANGDTVLFSGKETTSKVVDVILSVYRREFDGTFTELASEIDNDNNVFVTDPHPSLDYARYRIVAISNTTGMVSYYDMPGIPVNETAVVIQWNEAWSNFDVTSDAKMVEPSWSGSMLKIPYNIDISNNNTSEVSLIKYAGRRHPVSYYGTQLTEGGTWSMAIPKSDKETLYAIRRLEAWIGDVYVREPSGIGYWASITVSYSQKHLEMTIPITLNVTRVEGGA